MNSSAERSVKKRAKSQVIDSRYEVVPRKFTRNMDLSLTLPNEMLIHIFLFLSQEELYRKVQFVCKRWNEVAFCPMLWRKITVQPDVPTHVICRWLKQAPLLKEIHLKGRNDINVIAPTLSKFSKKLEILTIENRNQKRRPAYVSSQNLLQLMNGCKILNDVHFHGVQIYSHKFFSLLAKRKNELRTVKYCGPLTYKQMQILVQPCGNGNDYDQITLNTENGRNMFGHNVNGILSLENIMGRVHREDEDDEFVAER